MLRIPYLILTGVLLISAFNDIRFNKIPNWLTYPTILVGILYHTSVKGFEGFLFSIEGVGVGLGVFIIPYLMGGTGAGDVKLMAAVGGLLGPRDVFIAFLFTSIVGGIYALVLLIYHGYLRETAIRYGAILKTLILTRKFIYIPSAKGENKPKLCYGVAISAGTLIFLAFRLNF